VLDRRTMRAAAGAAGVAARVTRAATATGAAGNLRQLFRSELFLGIVHDVLSFGDEVVVGEGVRTPRRA